MTAVSRLPASIDKLMEVLVAADLTVFDGPSSDDNLDDCVYIGYDGDPNGRFKTSDTRQEWAGTVGANRRNEELDIICAVVASRGDNDTKLVRDAAYDILGTVESVLRANPGLDFSSPYVAGVRPRETYTIRYNDGISVRVVFMVTIRTRV